MGTFLQVMGWLFVAFSLATAVLFDVGLPHLIELSAGLVLVALGTITRRLDAIVPKPERQEVPPQEAPLAPAPEPSEWSPSSMGSARK